MNGALYLLKVETCASKKKKKGKHKTPNAKRRKLIPIQTYT